MLSASVGMLGMSHYCVHFRSVGLLGRCYLSCLIQHLYTYVQGKLLR